MTERKKRVLIVDDDQLIHLTDKQILKGQYECVSAYNGDEAKVILRTQRFDIVLLDVHMRTHEEGLEVLPALKESDPDLDIIIVSGNSEINLAIRAMRLGASAYLLKEHSAEQLIITIESVLSRRALLAEKEHFVNIRRRTLQKNKIIGESVPIKQLHRDIEKIKKTNANVIITGETGTGKELVARHIAEGDGRPFVAVDSSTITSSMAESILFGHEKGAFTHAVSQARGLFEEANGGTIYFDEIANMPLEIQAKILRVIQEKEVTRLGSTKVIPLSFRVVCATNKDLEKQVAAGAFKEDLFQRINVISLRIPPLRERRGDIPLLIGEFFQRFRYGENPVKIGDEAMRLLEKYPWPGNVRELSNLIANLCAMVPDRAEVEVEDLPQRIRDATLGAPASGIASLGGASLQIGDPREAIEKSGADYYSYMHSIEGNVLRELYRLFEGNVSQMSKSLKVSRSQLYAKLNAHQIQS